MVIRSGRHTVTEYFSMGGHGGFIWTSWGIALTVLTILVFTSVKSMRARERELARMEAEAPRRRRRRVAGANTPAEAVTAAGDNQ